MLGNSMQYFTKSSRVLSTDSSQQWVEIKWDPMNQVVKQYLVLSERLCVKFFIIQKLSIDSETAMNTRYTRTLNLNELGVKPATSEGTALIHLSLEKHPLISKYSVFCFKLIYG